MNLHDRQGSFLVTMGALHNAGIGAIRHEIQALDLDRVRDGAWEKHTMVAICLCS